MLVEKAEIVNYIPQRPPMVMVDGLKSHDDDLTVSRLHLNKENIFCNNGFFTEAGLIENIAQTAALRSGYSAKIGGDKPATGFIGAVKKFSLYELPKDTEILQTQISVKANLLNALIVEGKVFVDEKLMAEGELSIFTAETNS